MRIVARRGEEVPFGSMTPIKPAADLGDAGAEAPDLSMHALTGTFADPAIGWE